MATPFGLILTALIIGYLFGSIPFGLVLTRSAGLGDVRSIGSGNIGATNVLRTGNKMLAAATLLLDMLKGTAAVIITIVLAGHLFNVAPAAAYGAGVSAGLAAFLGHLFPVWLNFKGGKGVATYIGVLLGAAPLLALLFCGVWLAVALASRYSSLAALVACIATPIFSIFTSGTGLLFTALCLMSALLLWKHQDNIRRLMRGEESKIA